MSNKVAWIAVFLSAVAIIIGGLNYFTKPSSNDLKVYAKTADIATAVKNGTTDMATNASVDTKLLAYPDYQKVFGESLQNLRKRVVSIDTTGEENDTTWEVIPVIDLIRGTGDIKLVPQVHGKWRLAPEVKSPAAATKKKTIF